MNIDFKLKYCFSFFCILSLGFLSQLVGCSTAPEVKTQAYAKLNNQRTYEEEFPTVWKAIEESLRKYKVTHRDPDEVNVIELKQLTHRTLETDWIYGQSRDKYQEYQVNGVPRKIYLQTRFKYFVDVQKVIGGITVTVNTAEEVEKLKADSTSDGFTEVANPDPSRPNELLDRIKVAILAAPPI